MQILARCNCGGVRTRLDCATSGAGGSASMVPPCQGQRRGPGLVGRRERRAKNQGTCKADYFGFWARLRRNHYHHLPLSKRFWLLSSIPHPTSAWHSFIQSLSCFPRLPMSGSSNEVNITRRASDSSKSILQLLMIGSPAPQESHCSKR